MREIKFRAYDLKKRVIFPVHKIDFNKINQSIEFIQGYDNWDKDGYTVYGGGNMKYANKDRYILMQYTGLKDKNGNEIYEGDIVTYTREVTEYEGSSRPYSYLDLFEGEVVYASGCFWVNDRPLYELLEFEEEINIEVIGNIYDNKDLLEKVEE